MRDSINYNLKYFIVKMSGTKPMKNTMRKPSPAKMVTTKTKAETSAKTPPMKMKKSGMGKKC